MPAPGDAEKLLGLIAEHAPKLRAAGVTGRVTVDGVLSFDVGEPAPPAAFVKDDEDQAAGEEPSPLDDPETFGGSLPKLPRRDKA